MLSSTYKEISLESIDPGERFRRSYERIEELSASIQEKGLIQNIAVMEKSDGTYLLLAGGRRLAAINSLGWKNVNANIYPPMDEMSQREVELIENLQREEMSYAEQVALEKRIHDLEIQKHGHALKGQVRTGGANLSTTASLLGMSRQQLSNDLELADAIEEMPELGTKKNKAEAFRHIKKAKVDLLFRALAEKTQQNLTSLSDQKQRLVNSYIVGDAFDKMKELPAEQMHCIEMDPPYGVELEEISKSDNAAEIHKDYVEIPPSEYTTFLKKCIEESYRLLKPGGWLLLWHAMRWESVITQLFHATGFKFSDVPALWVKVGGSVTRAPDTNLGNLYEPFYYARKGAATLARPGRGNVFVFPRSLDSVRSHPAERPVELMSEILQTFMPPASRILVPFLGSGNTLLAAANLNMQAHGYDLSQTYKDHYILHVTEQNPGSYTSL